MIDTSNTSLNIIRLQNVSSTNPQFWPVARYALDIPISPDGNAYIWGGNEENPNATDPNMYIFDIYNLSWSFIQPSGDVPISRAGYSATYLPDGRILYLGGARIPNNRLVPMS